MDRIPKAGERYRHFKGREYEVIDLATHTETGESMVVYRSVESPYDCYVRPLGMFISKVDREKYPDAGQEYRFENMNSLPDVTPKASEGNEAKILQKPASEYSASRDVNPYLLEFLDAGAYEQKAEVLALRKNYLDEGILEAMALSMEIELPDGDFEKKFAYLKKNLEMFDLMEGTHMRGQG